MCDCYEPKCEIEGCKEYIPIHIADSNYPRETVQVFCSEHLPKEKATVFEVTKRFTFYGGNEKYYDYKEKGWKCAIRLCKGKVEPEAVGVFPNISNYYKTYIL
jgi:hypothetical protein